MKCKKPRQLDIELYFVGEMDSAASRELEKHLEECDVCCASLENLKLKKDEFLKAHPYYSFAPAQVSEEQVPWYDQLWERLWEMLMRPALVPVYGVLILALFLTPYLYREFMDDSGSDIIWKGKPFISSFVYQRGGNTYAGDTAATYYENDQIQILYTSATHTYMTLFSIDSRGTISFYYPESESSWCSMEIKPGSGLAYHRSIVLDNVEGWELIVALFSKEPTGEAAVRSWITQTIKGAAEHPHELKKALEEQPLAEGYVADAVLIKKGDRMGIDKVRY
jgi:hypothetical protein